MKLGRNMFAWCTMSLAVPLSAQSVNVIVQPAQPSFERSKCCMLLNFDFEVHNQGADTLALEAIQAVLLDSRGNKVGVRRAERGATAAGITPLGEASAGPGRITTVTNPFQSIDLKTPVASVEYTLRFRSPQGMISSVATISPVTYTTKSDLVVPLLGRVLVSAGRDATQPRSHLDQAVAHDLMGVKRQFNRYAYDFLVVDSTGALNHTGGATNDDWYGYSATVVAPAAGVVRVAENNQPDHKVTKGPAPGTLGDLQMIPGNYIVIDHENGECSLLGHLRQGSQSVEVGDRVTRGQRVAEVGLSGDSYIMPHLHYQLMDSCNFLDAEGLPSYFSGFVNVKVPADGLVTRGHVDAGDVLMVTPYFRVKP